MENAGPRTSPKPPCRRDPARIPAPAGKGDCYSDVQKEIADRAWDLILSDLGHHFTIRELAHALHVSQTQLKVCFHKVYGLPIYSCARRRRMAAAAERLRTTEDSVLEVAGLYGYENGSKFAAAFRQVVGVSPSEYRKSECGRREASGIPEKPSVWSGKRQN